MITLDRAPAFGVSNRLRRTCGAWLTFPFILAAASLEAAPSAVVTFGPYISHQVNVDGSGQNIAGDKGNEPSLAVSPLNPANVVVGWRKFDQPATGIRNGGFATSFDGGNSWSVGQLPALPTESRTDPVLEVDSQGNFYYQSMLLPYSITSVFKSTDGGGSWSSPVDQFYGDKNWMVIDKTGGASDGHIYSIWRPGEPNPDPNYVPRYFIRSTDGGLSYQEPDTLLPASRLGFGRPAVGPDGEVYLFEINEAPLFTDFNLGIFRGGHYFLKSSDARDPNLSPTFDVRQIDMGGHDAILFDASHHVPNPIGGHGDVQIATDRSAGPARGTIYLMAHVVPDAWVAGADPLDLHFVRSLDGGDTWSAPVRINDDAPAANSFQWFPMLDVAPNSRIDALWYDTRDGSAPTQYRQSRLYYAYSWDGGATWSPNQPVTPVFDTHLPYNIVNGEERQADKLGDYTQVISDAAGAHVAYTATYNGEQDVYYLKVFPDCNGNGLSDVLDIQARRSGDIDASHIPDSCENIVVPGDLDGDRDVDQLDVTLLTAARNRPASGPTDPMDLDRNGVINALDVRKQILLCTRLRCQAG